MTKALHDLGQLAVRRAVHAPDQPGSGHHGRRGHEQDPAATWSTCGEQIDAVRRRTRSASRCCSPALPRTTSCRTACRRSHPLRCVHRHTERGTLPHPYHHGMSDYARRERSQLADLLLEVGPDAPTLCAGWTTRDLAAHLVVRERRPDATVGVLIPPLAGHGEHVRKQKAAEPYDRVVAEVRNPPWWSPVSNPLTDEMFNAWSSSSTTRTCGAAAPGWAPRVLDAGEQKAIWKTVRFTARMGLRRLHMPVLLRAPGLRRGHGRRRRPAGHADRRAGRAGDVRLRPAAGREGGRSTRPRRPRRRCVRPSSASSDWPIQIGPDWPGRGANPTLRLIS